MARPKSLEPFTRATFTLPPDAAAHLEHLAELRGKSKSATLADVILETPLPSEVDFTEEEREQLRDVRISAVEAERLLRSDGFRTPAMAREAKGDKLIHHVLV